MIETWATRSRNMRQTISFSVLLVHIWTPESIMTDFMNRAESLFTYLSVVSSYVLISKYG